jgi:hypothetical protein
MISRANVRLFLEKCEDKLTKLRKEEEKRQLTFKYPEKGRCLQIKTELNYDVHYEWWIDKDNFIRVALHFEKQNAPALNKERYLQCVPCTKNLQEDELDKGELSYEDLFGNNNNWRHITIRKPLSSATEVTECDVDWAVKMMQLMLKTFDDAVKGLK